MKTTKQHFCPCCGYGGLASPAYDRLVLPIPPAARPPYELLFGAPSYDVCACCGYEFGNDDNPGTGTPVTFQAYLAGWIADGMRWTVPEKEPVGWSLERQLKEAGLK